MIKDYSWLMITDGFCQRNTTDSTIYCCDVLLFSPTACGHEFFKGEVYAIALFLDTITNSATPLVAVYLTCWLLLARSLRFFRSLHYRKASTTVSGTYLELEGRWKYLIVWKWDFIDWKWSKSEIKEIIQVLPRNIRDMIVTIWIPKFKVLTIRNNN